MNRVILDFIEKCEGWKVAVKNFHWSADNLSQHKLCDDIASAISDFEDLVSEVEQSISGKISLNGFTPEKYNAVSLKAFVESVIAESKKFLSKLERMGDNYVGIKSECETFIGTMQRNLYLVNFTIKENMLNESRPKNPSLVSDGGFDKFQGRMPTGVRSRINRIYRIVSKYGIDSRKYHDDHWQAIEDYYRVISSLGCEVEMKPCGSVNNVGSLESDGGYCDYAEDGMPRSKQYAIRIIFPDDMVIEGYIKCMAAGTVEDPFDSYDTCIVLWPKASTGKSEISETVYLTESQLARVVKESARKVLREYGETEGGQRRLGALQARLRKLGYYGA